MKFRSLSLYFFLCLFCLAGYAQTHQIDGQYMTDWLILGPFEGIDLQHDYLADYGGESKIEPKAGDSVQTRDGQTLMWTRHQSDKSLIDFLAILGQHDNSTAYAFTHIEAPADDDDVQFFIGKDDGAAVWLDDIRVYINPENKPHYYDDETFNSAVKQGKNRCLVKIFQGIGDWSFSLRGIPSSRAEITGVVLSVDGKPVPLATVRIEQKGQHIFERQADTTGQYQVSIFPVYGRYDLTAFSDQTGNWLLNQKIQVGTRKEHTFHLKPAISIEGSILMLDKQSPHVDLVVQAMKPAAIKVEREKPALENTDQIMATTLTDERGQYRFFNLRPGKYEVRCHIPGRLVYHPDQPGQSVTVLNVRSGKQIRDINFYLAEFKKGSWRTYTTYDGLAGNRVNHILRDTNGNLWFATGNGVSKYDGTQFVNFTKGDGLTDNTVLKIHQATDGAMWFATQKGLSKLEGEAFTNFTKDNGLLDAQLNDFFVDSKGLFWLGSGSWQKLDGGVTRYDGKNFHHYRSNEGLISDVVNSIYEDRTGMMWFGTPTAGISRFDGADFTNFTEQDGLPSNCINQAAISQDSNGDLWFGTADRFGARGGLCQFDGQTFRSFVRHEGMQTNNAGGIYFTTDGEMWLGSGREQGGGGALLYDGAALVHFTEQDGLAGNTVHSIYHDVDGSIWFATNDGISRYDTVGLLNLTTRDGLVGNQINSIIESEDGRLYFATGNWGATSGNGLSIYDGQNFINMTYQHGLPNKPIVDIHLSSNGKLWLGIIPGLSLIVGEKITQYTEKDGLAYFWIGDIYQDREDKTLWLATGGGISHFDGENFVNYTQKDGLLTNFVRCVYQDDDNQLWFGLNNPNGFGGISHFNPESQTFTNFTSTGGLPEAKWFNVIQRGPKGDLWIGAGGPGGTGGISRYDGTNFTTLTVKDGLSSNNISDLLFDSDGLLWAATGGGGVSIYDGTFWSSLDDRDGLVSNSVWQIHQDHSGYMWFGTNNGLTRYRKSKQKPPVRITAVQTDQTYTNLASIPDLVYGERVTFKYDTTDFRTIPEKRQYRYRIKEVSQEWSKPVRTTIYDHKFQQQGHYTFEVQYIDRDLNYSDPASVELTINPPLFYQTMGFLIGVGVVFSIALVFGGVQTWKISEQRRRIREYQELAVEELEEAQGIQMGLMPQADPDLPGFDITGTCVTASEVGGDFFDYIPLGQQELGIAVADVSGKQMQGAMNAVMTNGILQLAARELETDGPSEIMAKLNGILTQRMKNDTNVTMVFGVLNTNDKTFTFCNAGHHAHPVLCRDGQVESLTNTGFPLGMKENVAYPTRRLQLQSGDAVILMSDGIIETLDDEEIMYAETDKMETLLKTVKADTPAIQIQDQLVEDAIQHGADETLRDDDITVVVIKMN
jgi:serine phosphatase RsbU (regulator of sigma subunit)/ligand-binding sensor domain-containing protein